MSICIFSGTFNPIHNAHLQMAEFILSNYNFDKILFIPAYKPPHKNYDDKMSKHRYNMVKLAIADNSRFDISDIEYKNDRKSYTYLTILELKKLYNIKNRISMAIGTDAFKKIETWYEAEKLKDLAEFIVFTREREAVDFSDLAKKGYCFKCANMQFLDISSTNLREKIKNGEDISEFVSEKVKEYIKENELYRN